MGVRDPLLRVVEVHDAADPALAHEREGSSEVWREPGIPASENGRTDEGMKLVDEIGVKVWQRRGSAEPRTRSAKSIVREGELTGSYFIR